MENMCKRILACGSHPDDCEWGAFGTLLKLKESRIFIYVASLGGFNDLSSGIQRKLESLESFKLLGYTTSIWWRDEIGLRMDDYPDIVSDLESIFEQATPDLILVPSKCDTHQDHRFIHDVTMSAVRRRKVNILSYATLSSDFEPNFYADITGQFETKKLALSKHLSQQHKDWMSEEYLETFNSDSRARLLGIKYSERFKVERWFL